MLKPFFPQTQKSGLLPKNERGKNWGDFTELTGQPFIVRGGRGVIIITFIEREENLEDSALAVLLFIA